MRCSGPYTGQGNRRDQPQPFGILGFGSGIPDSRQKAAHGCAPKPVRNAVENPNRRHREMLEQDDG